MKKYHIIPFIFWSLLSFFVMFFSYKLDLGRLHNPGPGFAPFLLGLLLLPISIYPIIKFVIKKREGDGTANEMESRVNYKKIGFVFVSLLAYSFLFEKLGFVVSTSIFLVFLLRSMGNRWVSALIAVKKGLVAMGSFRQR